MPLSGISHGHTGRLYLARRTNHTGRMAESDSPTPAPNDAEQNDSPQLREVRFEYSPHFPRILEHLNSSLLVSTYQAGKLGVVGVDQGRLTFSFLNFHKAMGVAVGRKRIAVGAVRQVFFLHSAPELAPHIDPAGAHDACFLTRGSHQTGNIHVHEMAWGSEGLWVVNTLFSSLCTLHDGYSFVPRWRPPFVSELIAQDRCHLNGVAIEDGRPRYVTCHGDQDEPGGWRETKATGGVLIDVESGESVARDFAMPHSPRLYDGKLWVLNSGHGSIEIVDPASGRHEPVERVPGFTRGLSFAGQFAFVGLSKIRETSVFGGLPIESRRDDLRAGVAVVDLVSGKAVAALQFHSGVDEIFSVEVLAGCRNPALRGPEPERDGMQDIWLVPPDGTVPESSSTERHGIEIRSVSEGSELAGDDRRSRFGLPSSERGPMVPGRSPDVAGPDSLFRSGMSLQRQGRLTEALSMLKQAATLAPDRPDIWTELGNVYQQLNDQQTALGCYRRATQAAPDFVPARQNLGYLLFNHGEPEEAIEHYEAALKQQPSTMNRLLAATVLPVIYDSAADVQRWRKRLAGQVRELAESGATIDTTNTLVPTNFFMAYQGLNDVEIARDLGRIYVGQASPLANSVNTSEDAYATNRRIRVGFLSAYFRDHTMGRQNIGRVERLGRDDFEVTVISVGRHRDEMAKRFEAAADRFVVVPRSVEAARRQITELGLDILIFTDVGMDALTYTLAFSRMAPVQCATWGHPDTTGSPAMDYFISSELLELSDADAHYTEKLLRLPNLGIYYERPQCSRSRETSEPNSHESGYERSRRFFGLDSERHVYLCPQTLFKFHPDFDDILAGILNRDSAGELVLIEGRVPNWTRRLKRRFERTLPGGVERVRFLPPQPNDKFLQLLAATDVMIDPHHFGGGNTSYEALAVGTPVVTWPGPYLRGRITQALYQKMGLTDLIVDSADAYVELAVRLGTDADYRQTLHERILATGGVLFEDPEEVRAFENGLRRFAAD